jgi:predicted helicase
MKHPKIPGKNEKDLTKIMYNEHVTVSGIPLDAYKYIVNGKSAIGWLMDRYQIKTDKESGILNDPNTWSNDPKYIIELVKKIVTVSIETNRIVNSLPRLLDEESTFTAA